MTRSLLSRFATVAGIVGMALVVLAGSAPAQDSSHVDTDGYHPFIIRPEIGLQTMWFNGDYPVSEGLSPARGDAVMLGGGIFGPSDGIHLGLEIIPDTNGILRFPVSLEAFFLNGKTTFPFSALTERPIRLLTLDHTAQIYSAGAGVTFSFFKEPTLYFSAQARVNYIPTTSYTARWYVLETDQTDSIRTYIPDPGSHTRFGAYLKMGTQVAFFEPFMLDFSVGYGGLNLGGRNTDPSTQHNLIVVDTRNAIERTLGYIGFGLNLIWKM